MGAQGSACLELPAAAGGVPGPSPRFACDTPSGVYYSWSAQPEAGPSLLWTLPCHHLQSSNHSPGGCATFPLFRCGHRLRGHSAIRWHRKGLKPPPSLASCLEAGGQGRAGWVDGGGDEPRGRDGVGAGQGGFRWKRKKGLIVLLPQNLMTLGLTTDVHTLRRTSLTLPWTSLRAVGKGSQGSRRGGPGSCPCSGQRPPGTALGFLKPAHTHRTPAPRGGLIPVLGFEARPLSSDRGTGLVGDHAAGWIPPLTPGPRGRIGSLSGKGSVSCPQD